jgi:hypothetical protein
MDIEMEQELARPYVYVSRSNYGRVANPQIGFDLISIKDLARPAVLWRYRVPQPELHEGLGATNGKYFKRRRCRCPRSDAGLTP